MMNAPTYKQLLSKIGRIYEGARTRALTAVEVEQVKAYWEIGRHIVEFEQAGKATAVFGTKLLERISRDLTLQYGKGFSRSNIVYMRLFYLKYPIGETVSHQLTWSH